MVLLKAHPAAVEAKVVAAVAAAEMVVEVDAAEMVVEATVVAMPAVETEAGDAHAVTHFRYSTGPGAA